MTRDDAVGLLNSDEPAERLRGARGLAGLALTDDERLLVERRLQTEPDAWVQSALRSVLEPRPEPRVLEDETVVDVRTLSEIQAQATERVTRLVLHEIRPIVTSIKTWASREIASFDESRTAQALSRLSQLLESLIALNEASSAPARSEFDLTTLVGDCALEILDRGERISFGRSDSVVVVGDVRLVSLALRNCLRNAVEATASAQGAAPVTVNWGSTDRDYWIAILDEGVGLPESGDRLLDPGITTKTADGMHFGIGLTIAQRAMHSLRGSVDLRPREPRGTVAELRWGIP